MIVAKKDLETFIREYPLAGSDLIFEAWKYFGIISKATKIDQTENFKEYLELTEQRKRLEEEEYKLTTAKNRIKDRINTLGARDIYDANQKRVAENMRDFTSEELKQVVNIAGNNSNKRLMEYANDELIARKKDVFLDRSMDSVYDLTPNSSKANSTIPDHIEDLTNATEAMSNELNNIYNRK